MSAARVRQAKDCPAAPSCLLRLPSGDYVARFFKDDGYDQLAQHAFKILPAPSVAPAKPEFEEGESLVVNFAHGPG